MYEIAFSFIIEGAESENAANEIRDIIKEDLDYDVSIKQEIKKSHRNDEKLVDPVALAALIISIPAAILATTELVNKVIEKINNRKKLDKTLEKIKKVTLKKEVKIKIIDKNGVVKEISQIEITDIIE